MSMISVKGLRKNFGKHEVLKGIDIEIQPGEVVAIVGPSGCGKSTFLRCLNLLEKPSGGSILYHDVDLVSGAPKETNKVLLGMGMVFQQFNLFPHKTVLDNITLAPIKVQGTGKQEAEERALKLLRTVGLEDKRDAYPNQLSGGQQQRIAIARSLALQPEVMLFDEPTSALDAENRTLLLELLEKQRETAGILFISHDVAALRTLCGTVHVMEHGMLTEQGTIQELLEHPKQAWTKEYAAANHPVSREGWTWTD